MIKYNKLVRNKIPEQVLCSGEICATRKATKEEIQDLLLTKLDEEVAEYKEEPSLQELADIMEVCYALAKERFGAANNTLDRLVSTKRDNKGSFTDRIILLFTAQKDDPILP